MEHPTFHGDGSYSLLWVFFCSVGSLMKPLRRKVITEINDRAWEQIWVQVADRVWTRVRITVDVRFANHILSELKERQRKQP